MLTKKTVSMVALVAVLTCAQAFAVRVANPRVVNELKAFYKEMEAEGRLGELSDNAKQVCSCIEKGSEHDKDALRDAVREAQAHGHLVRAYAHPSLLAGRTNNQR